MKGNCQVTGVSFWEEQVAYSRWRSRLWALLLGGALGWFWGKVYKTDHSLLSNTWIVCCYKRGLCTAVLLTVGKLSSLSFIVLPRLTPTFVIVGRCHYIALKSEELALPTHFERMWAVYAFLLPAPTMGRKISSSVFVLNYCQDVFCLAFCTRYCLVLSAFCCTQMAKQRACDSCVNKY